MVAWLSEINTIPLSPSNTWCVFLPHCYTVEKEQGGFYSIGFTFSLLVDRYIYKLSFCPLSNLRRLLQAQFTTKNENGGEPVAVTSAASPEHPNEHAAHLTCTKTVCKRRLLTILREGLCPANKRNWSSYVTCFCFFFFKRRYMRLLVNFKQSWSNCLPLSLQSLC